MSSLFGIASNSPSGAASFYPETIDQSLRFEDGNTARLSKTPSSASNRKTFTISTWVKRGNLGTNDVIFGATASGYADFFRFNSSNELEIAVANSYQIGTNAKFRDTTNWYHIVLAFDVTQSTSTDRIKIYVNGTQQSLKVIYNAYPANQDYAFNNTTYHVIGSLQTAYAGYDFDGYMAEFNFIDGTALTPSSFGETKNGVWIPKEISGLTYGTNGFRLTFANSSALGDDTSGNGNDYTSSGLAATDVVPDSPTNNFSTFNNLHVDTDDKPTYSEGNLRMDATSASWHNAASTFWMSSGKWYSEFRLSNVGDGCLIGIGKAPSTNTYVGTDANGYGYLAANGYVYHSNSQTQYGSSFTSGDIIGVALDMDNGNLYFYKNGTIQNSGTAVNSSSLVGEHWFVGCSSAGTAGEVRVNFGQDGTFNGSITAGNNADENGHGNFKYSVPSGYLAMCAANLPDTTFAPNQDEQGDDHHNAVLYTGTQQALSVTGVGFRPDWIWFKSRNATWGNAFFDSTRGNTKQLKVESGTENTISDGVTSFDADGFSLAATTSLEGRNQNNSGSTYIAWCWKLNGGTTSSNTDGNVTSTVQVNSDAGVSVITFPANSTNGTTIGHGLGVAPKMIIMKGRESVSAWLTYHHELGADRYVSLSSFAASAQNADVWGNTAPTSTVFTAGLSVAGLSSGGANDGVAYCFAEKEGFSKFGQYRGKGSTDGQFIFTGFKPAFVMVKSYDNNLAWFIMDNRRLAYNGARYRLIASQNNTEHSDDYIDLLSNGFKFRSTSGNVNGYPGYNYIYMAFASSQTFKFSNAE